MTDKSAKMLERVRALMAKAADPSIESAEADLFRQKADELMTTYAIDSWMVEQAQAGRDARPEPEKRMMDFQWWRTNPFRDQLWWMFDTVARHCRCKSVTRKAVYRPDYVMPVFGLPSDLDWFDLLFTSLMVQMIQQVDPQPRPELTLMENLAMMREAGMPWKVAIERIIQFGDMADVDVDPDATFDDVYKPWVHEYRRWCRATGHPQSYVNQQTFRRNFAEGFADGINDRLYRIRRETEQHYDADHEAGGMALAVRDIGQVIQEEVYKEYPDLKPHPPECECDDCHTRKCRDENCVRPRCVAKRKPIKLRAASQAGPKIDWAARNAGRAAAEKADISSNPARGIGRDKGLPEGS
jgi:hypothetical protein